ncbi:hypothetical protein CMI37_16015 [Candidatus Pacearchaeota archaeon]|nr:hypothetical protein [Candidatus Pacearchaeota archaeon]|tara:strand:- start:2234 stop:2638 length:405 start_codon:yes stop_codon:yes gene_type:complete
MEQRVNIQYSIDMDELPTEVHRMLKKGSQIVDDLASKEMQTFIGLEEKEVLSLQTLQHIESARKKLAAIDYALNDATNIVSGFINLQVSPPPDYVSAAERGAPENSTVPQPEIQPQWNELTKKIEQFKNQNAPE